MLYAHVAQIFEDQKRSSPQTGLIISQEYLLEQFNSKIESIIKTVKDKLHGDAFSNKLVWNQKKKVEPPVSASGKKSDQKTGGKNIMIQQQVEEIFVADYKDNQQKFDEILDEVCDYFELFKNNTDKLEDLWL